MNIAKLQAQLQHIPDQALIGYVQNPDGQVPSYLALAELSRRKEIRAGGAQQAQPQAKKPSIAEQAIAEHAPGVAGLQLPDDMYSEKSMAAGGIVAFDEGGDVDALGRDLSNAWVPDYAYHSFMPYLAYPQDAVTAGVKKFKDIRDKNTMVIDPVTGKPISKADLRDKPITQAAHDVANQVRGLPADANPASNLVSLPKGSVLDSLRTNPIDNTNPLAALATRAPIEDKPKADLRNNRKDRPSAAPALPAGIGDLAAPKIAFDDSAYNAAMLPKRTAQEAMLNFKNLMGEDTGLATLKDRLAGMEERSKAEELQAPWMALARAGFGMAAGKSPFALQNLAEGAGAGIADLAASKDKLRAAEEKRFTIQSQIAQTERAAQAAAVKFGTDSEQYADAQNRTTQLHKMDAKATANLHDAANQLTAQGNAIKAQEAAWTHDYQIGSLANQRAQVGKLSDYETYLSHAQKDPANYKTIQTKEGPKQIFDIDKVQGSYWNARGLADTKEQAMLPKLYKDLADAMDPIEKARIQGTINRIEGGAGGTMATGPRKKPLGAF